MFTNLAYAIGFWAIKVISGVLAFIARPQSDPPVIDPRRYTIDEMIAIVKEEERQIQEGEPAQPTEPQPAEKENSDA